MLALSVSLKRLDGTVGEVTTCGVYPLPATFHKVEFSPPEKLSLTQVNPAPASPMAKSPKPVTPDTVRDDAVLADGVRLDHVEPVLFATTKLAGFALESTSTTEQSLVPAALQYWNIASKE